MATKQGAKKAVAVRPTLAEVKQQPGHNLFVTYEGVDGGNKSIPPHRPRFAGDIVEDLVIEPWKPKLITEDWLDDVEFIRLYEKYDGIKVWKTDERPSPPDLKLPEELARVVNDNRQRMALNIAMSPYDEQMKDMVQIESHDRPIPEANRWESEEVYPFLEAVLFFEKRLLARKEVIRDIEARLKKIDKKTEEHNRRRSWR